MLKSIWNVLRYGFEGVALLGAACFMALAVIPIALHFQLVKIFQGNPFWFIPSLDRDRRR